MYCSKCGSKNDDGSTFCVNCGALLREPPSRPQQGSSPRQQATKLSTVQLPQNAVIGGILNFLFPGLGYWYLGYRKVLGIHPVLFLILIWIVDAVIGYVLILIFIGYLLPLLIHLFLGYDAYVKAIGQPGWIKAE